ncbi:hypothetical protein CYMTET_53449 [Cymbomonas tetramitiformis]|uniref:Uncharacterized protein n=1 Tax=Cymbomonas tetramitiformis TaxID=36881 RepID=A0AAE0EQC1_9CHLO|nr:hypothetical protein CYMTET_53449 [Cymbomonas tetramitiformis]
MFDTHLEAPHADPAPTPAPMARANSGSDTSLVSMKKFQALEARMSAKDAEDLTLFRSLVSDGIIQKDAGSVLLSSPPAKKRKTQAV